MVIGLCHRDDSIIIGRLGELQLLTGWYLYVGSAFGPGGLAARVGRHLQRLKTKRWHFDYLRPNIHIKEVWYSQYEQRLEHDWAAYWLARQETDVVMNRFGASDCGCTTHLFMTHNKPGWQNFQQWAGSLQIDVERIVINED